MLKARPARSSSPGKALAMMTRATAAKPSSAWYRRRREARSSDAIGAARPTAAGCSSSPPWPRTMYSTYRASRGGQLAWRALPPAGLRGH